MVLDGSPFEANTSPGKNLILNFCKTKGSAKSCASFKKELLPVRNTDTTHTWLNVADCWSRCCVINNGVPTQLTSFKVLVGGTSECVYIHTSEEQYKLLAQHFSSDDHAEVILQLHLAFHAHTSLVGNYRLQPMAKDSFGKQHAKAAAYGPYKAKKSVKRNRTTMRNTRSSPTRHPRGAAAAAAAAAAVAAASTSSAVGSTAV
jgi:hypothetical protein